MKLPAPVQLRKLQSGDAIAEIAALKKPTT